MNVVFCIEINGVYSSTLLAELGKFKTFLKQKALEFFSPLQARIGSISMKNEVMSELMVELERKFCAQSEPANCVFVPFL